MFSQVSTSADLYENQLNNCSYRQVVVVWYSFQGRQGLVEAAAAVIANCRATLSFFYGLSI